VITEDDLFQMVCLRRLATGLHNNVWLGPRGHAGYGARIYVQTDHRLQFDLGASDIVSIDGKVLEGQLATDDLAAVRRYIALNRQAIIDHWEERTDGIELGRALVRLP
jgi:hypothetical protein